MAESKPYSGRITPGEVVTTVVGEDGNVQERRYTRENNKRGFPMDASGQTFPALPAEAYDASGNLVSGWARNQNGTVTSPTGQVYGGGQRGDPRGGRWQDWQGRNLTAAPASAYANGNVADGKLIEGWVRNTNGTIAGPDGALYSDPSHGHSHPHGLPADLVDLTARFEALTARVAVLEAAAL